MTWEQKVDKFFMEDYTKKNEEKGRMKLTHGFDYTEVVGEIFVNKMIYDGITRGVEFKLVANLKLEATGVEIIGLSLVPIEVAPVHPRRYVADI